MSSAAVANPMVSPFDKAASAIKIQRWWRKIKSDAVVADDVLECAICYETIGDQDSATTACGHKFHFSCLAKAMQVNPSCPLCRAPFIGEGSGRAHGYGWDLSAAQRAAPIHGQREARIRSEGYDEGHRDGFAEGRDAYEEYYQDRWPQHEQVAYDRGLVDGRSIANEDLRLMRAELERVRASLRAQTELSTNQGEIVRQLMRERDAAQWVASRHVNVPKHSKENSKI